MSAICLVSGGMDSLLTAIVAIKKHTEVTFLHIDYGQKTSLKEKQSFKKIANFYKVKSISIKVPYYKIFGGNSLTDRKIKVTAYKKNQIPSSYVPFRNANFLTIAVALAETIKANYIYIGAVYEDSSGYPDCSPTFYKDFNKLIQSGTLSNIKVITPVLHLNKSQIIKKLVKLNAPLSSTWSCYQSTKKACGICDSCVLRLNAFKKAKIKDPICYV